MNINKKQDIHRGRSTSYFKTLRSSDQNRSHFGYPLKCDLNIKKKKNSSTKKYHRTVLQDYI